MGSVLTALLTQIASLISGGIGGAIGTVTTLISGGADQLLKFHKEGIAFARDMGMSLNQAQAYTRTLTENTAKLAHQYGVTAEQIMAVQRGISEATNRQLMLNQSQTEGFVALNKLVGEATANKFAEQIMQNMGGQIDTVQNAVSKAYMTAAKNGLNAKKVSADIANNLSMMNKLSFKNGVDGLTKMAVQAQKVGLSLNQVESVARSFMDFDKSIEHAAQLQMLGGAAGSLGGNPLDMMYEANYDPEALQDRMIKMMSGYAKFDEKTGMAKINGMNMDFVRNIAKAMGMDEGEAVKLAKRNSEIKYKESKLGNLQGYSDTQKNAILNKSFVENGKVYVNDKNGEKVDITGGNVPSELLDFISKYEGMDELEVAKQQAQELTDIKAKIDGFWESTKAEFAKVFEPYIPKIQEMITKYGTKAMTYVPRIAEGVQTIVTTGVDIIKGVRDFFKSHETLMSILKSGFKFIGDHLAEVTIGLLGLNVLKKIGGIKLSGPATNTVGGAAAKQGGNLLKNIWGASKGMFTGNTWSYKYGRANGEGRLLSAAKAPGRAFSMLSKGGKMLTAGGAGLGIGMGVYNAVTADNNADRGAGIGSAVGTAVGAALGGPVGAAIGGFLGDFGGRFIGEHWGDITDIVSKAWEAMANFFKDIWDGVADAWKSTINWFKGAWSSVTGVWDKVSNWFSDKWNKIVGTFSSAVDKFMNFVSDPWGAVKDVAKGAVNKVKNFFGFAEGGFVPGTGTGDTVPAMLTPGEYVVPKEDIVKAKPVGQNDFTYKPGRTETSKVGDSIVTVKDFNINLGGTLRLDGSGSSANLNVSELLKDPQFIGQLKDVISDAISSSYNGGRKMNDIATMRGMVAQTTTIGRRG